MLSRDRLRAYLPYYVAMIVLLSATVAAVELAVGGLGFWPSVAVIVVSALVYEYLLRRLGWVPEPPG